MLYPGTYEVRVKRGYYARSNLPTAAYLVNAAYVVSGDLAGQVYDLKTVNVSGKVTLNGADPVPTTSCSTTSNPDDAKVELTFTDAKQGYSFSYSILCRDSGFNFAGMLYPGTYEVRVKRGYYVRSNVPTAAYLVNAALVVSGDRSGEVYDIKSLIVSGRVLLNGMAPTAATSCSGTSNPDDSKADVSFLDPVQGYSFSFSSLCKDAGFTFSGMMYPGTYEVRVKRGYYARSNLPLASYLVTRRLRIP
jgi:hypothetical protein